MPGDFDLFPVLHTARLSLVETTASHAPDLYRLFTDKWVTEFYSVVPFKEEAGLLPVIASFGKRFKEQTGIRWGIALHRHKDIIGTIGFHSFNRGGTGSIVFALMPEYHHKGYITEAIIQVLKFGFEELVLKRIEAEVMPGNVSSAKVLVKAGFAYEGLFPKKMEWEGRLYDMNRYSIVKTF